MTRALLTILLLALPAWGGPVLVLKPTNADLGIVEGDQIVQYSLMIHNEGDSTLVIEEVAVTCGCTVAVLPDSTVEPGEAVPLKGSFNTRKMEGEIHKAIFLFSNDPAREKAVLTVDGFVVREVSFYPPQVFFSNARIGKGTTKTVTIRSGTGVPLEIGEVKTMTDRFQLEVKNLERAGDYEIDLHLLPQDEKGVMRDTMSVQTNVVGFEEIRIPILGQIRR
jgi:hypothetical protein